ncbi:transcriptional regulator FilR1 domain-containing protein [Halobacterium noricense]|uniref:transcriptional regulator FilR1 domain-containing protein n=1 Tax=Halobacterium noricense TaxID=223182 RepID=UPI001E56E93E|nr:hypothetical protein [Halobacterium noricense]UHH24044.1 hypothetical protein LT974_08560 [Halobacterium noricense]
MSEGNNMLKTVLRRAEVLHLVCNEMPEKRNLEDEVAKSRPTIDRAIRELEEEHLVCRDNGLCKPTSAGQLANELYEQFEQSFGRLSKIEQELAALPVETTLPGTILEGASLFQTPDHAPYTTIDPLVDDLLQADNIVVMTPVLISPYLEEISNQRNASQIEISLITTETVAETFNTGAANSLTDDSRLIDQLVVSDALPQYGLILVDGAVSYTLIFTDTNHLSAVIRNTRPDTVEWTRKKIVQSKQHGRS